jgi:hypothetical protein
MVGGMRDVLEGLRVETGSCWLSRLAASGGSEEGDGLDGRALELESRLRE